MTEKYKFKVKKCYCGTDLSGLEVPATSNRYGNLPQGKCPECGRDMLLDAPPVEPVIPAPMKAPATKAKSTSKR